MDKLLEHLRTFLIAVISAGVLYGGFTLIFGTDNGIKAPEPILSGPAETASETEAAQTAPASPAALMPNSAETKTAGTSPAESQTASFSNSDDFFGLDEMNEPAVRELSQAYPMDLESETLDAGPALIPSLSSGASADPAIDDILTALEETKPLSPVSDGAVSDNSISESDFLNVSLSSDESAQTAFLPASLPQTEADLPNGEPIDFFDNALNEAADEEIKMAAVPFFDKMAQSGEPAPQPAVIETVPSTETASAENWTAAEPVSAKKRADSLADNPADVPVENSVENSTKVPTEVSADNPANVPAENSANIPAASPEDSSILSSPDAVVPMLEVQQVENSETLFAEGTPRTEFVLEEIPAETEPLTASPAEVPAPAASAPAADSPSGGIQWENAVLESAPAPLPEPMPAAEPESIAYSRPNAGPNNAENIAAKNAAGSAELNIDAEKIFASADAPYIYNDSLNNSAAPAENDPATENGPIFSSVPVSLPSEPSVETPNEVKLDAPLETPSTETAEPLSTESPIAAEPSVSSKPAAEWTASCSEQAAPAETAAEMTAVSSSADVWFLDNTRTLDNLDGIRFWHQDGGKFVPSSFAEYSAGDSTVPTIILIHGNLSDAETTLRYGMMVKYRIDRLQAVHFGSARYRLVIWKWPSEKTYIGIRTDSQYKAQIAEQTGCTLASFLAALPPEQPVTLIGFSFGVRTIGTGLSVLNARSSSAARYNILFLGAAADAGTFSPNGKYAASIPMMNQLVNVFNPNDKVLKFYPMLYRGRRIPAIGIGPVAVCGQTPVQAFSINSSCYGPEHRFAHYFAAVPGQQLESLVFGSAAN